MKVPQHWQAWRRRQHTVARVYVPPTPKHAEASASAALWLGPHYRLTHWNFLRAFF